MRSYRDLIISGPSVVTIGVFDGVHLGHRRLLGATAARAKELGVTSVAITLHPRPRDVLRPNGASLYVCTVAERAALMESVGLDHVVVLDFDREVAATSAEGFMAELLSRTGLVELWIGHDFALGRGRAGDANRLAELGQTDGYSVHVVEQLLTKGERVSTTLVQQRLREGDMAGAAALLGRLPVVTGPVVRGAGRGRTINVPTANVGFATDIVLPANGVYAVRCGILGRSAPATQTAIARSSPCDEAAGKTPEAFIEGVASIGIRPTFDAGARSVEVFLLDFDEDIYDCCLWVEFIARLRPELKYESVAALVGQIRLDIVSARQWFDAAPGTPY